MRSSRNIAKLKQARTNLQDAYDNATVDFIQGKIDQISHLHVSKQHSAAWKAINEITGRKDRPSITTKGGSTKKRKDNWLDHFKKLLGESPPTTPNIPKVHIANRLNIPITPFSMKELKTVITSIQSKKSPGLDNIPALIWKDEHFHPFLLDLCNQVFTNLECPPIWITSGIIPVPKKGDLSGPCNYRGISLTPIAAKIFNKLILNRLVPALDHLLRRNQNGFRRKRSTISQILSLRRIVEEMRNANKELTLVFVDFKKAFDSINRNVMFEILALYGIPPEIIKAIKVLYTNTKAKVITTDGETDVFNIVAGVLQGDTLAPFLFIIVLDYVLRISLDVNNNKGLLIKPRGSRRHPAKYITDIDFADDIAIPSNTVENAESLLHSLEEAAAYVGLVCNESKTEFISTSINPSMSAKSGKQLKEVSDFKYLGSYIMNSEKDFKTRKVLAWSACNKLDKIWQSNLPLHLKLNLFKSTVEPILMYGSETWTLHTRQQRRLDGCYTNLLRRVQNISWKQHYTLQQIYDKIPPVSERLAQRRVQFAGHCYRAEGELISDLILWKPSKGRKLTYPDVVARDTGLEVQDLHVGMADREWWRKVVSSISAKAAR